MAITHTYDEARQIDIGIPGILHKAELFLAEKGWWAEPQSFKDLYRSGLDANEIIWLFSATPKVSDQIKRTFACDCAARVMPIYERWNAVDRRPQIAIEMARKYAEGLVTLGTMKSAMEEACNIADGIDADDAQTEAAVYAIEAAAWASDDVDLYVAFAAGSSISAVEFDAFVGVDKEAKATELKWQVNRLIELVEAATNGEAKP